MGRNQSREIFSSSTSVVDLPGTKGSRTVRASLLDYSALFLIEAFLKKYLIAAFDINGLAWRARGIGWRVFPVEDAGALNALSRAASTRARSCSLFTGRFRRSIVEPNCLRSARRVTDRPDCARFRDRWPVAPRCRISKQPFVTTRRLPRALISARHAARPSQEISFSRKFTLWILAQLFPAWQSLSVQGEPLIRSGDLATKYHP